MVVTACALHLADRACCRDSVQERDDLGSHTKFVNNASHNCQGEHLEGMNSACALPNRIAAFGSWDPTGAYVMQVCVNRGMVTADHQDAPMAASSNTKAADRAGQANLLVQPAEGIPQAYV